LKRGKFVVFEGVEGCGKTTQLRRSHQWLIESGWLARLQSQDAIGQVITTREPGGTDLGKTLRQLLLTQTVSALSDRAELLLYAADRSQHVESLLRPQLAAGGLVLCDRYTDSTVAYQGHGRGLDLSLIAHLNQIATEGLTSDLTLWLDLDAATGLSRTRQRGASDRIEQADLAFHQRVQQGFGDLATKHPDRIVRIDAAQPEEAVAEQIQAVLTQRFQMWLEAAS